MNKRYQKYALIFLAAVVISLLICLGLEKWFVVDLSFKDMLVMAAILVILKLMNRVLSVFKRKEGATAANWLKQLVEMLVVTFTMILILSGLSLIGYDTISFKKSLLLVVAAVPGIEFFLIMRRYVAKTESRPDRKSSVTAAAAPAPVAVEPPEDNLQPTEEHPHLAE